MIKVNSKVIIKSLLKEDEEKRDVAIEKIMSNMDLNFTDIDRTYYCPPVMIVEGFANIKIHPHYQEYNKCAKCVWYNTRNELQSEFINLELLTEL